MSVPPSPNLPLLPEALHAEFVEALAQAMLQAMHATVAATITKAGNCNIPYYLFHGAVGYVTECTFGMVPDDRSRMEALAAFKATLNSRINAMSDAGEGKLQ